VGTVAEIDWGTWLALAFAALCLAGFLRVSLRVDRLETEMLFDRADLIRARADIADLKREVKKLCKN